MLNNFSNSGTFIIVRTTYFDKIEDKLKFTTNVTHLNLRHVESISTSSDIIVEGVKYKYYNVQTTSQHFGCVSSDIGKFFRED